MASPRLTDTNRSPRLGFNYAQQLREFPLVSLSPHKEWRSRRPDSGSSRTLCNRVQQEVEPRIGQRQTTLPWWARHADQAYEIL